MMLGPHTPEILTELARKAGAHTRGLVRGKRREKMVSLVAWFNVKVEELRALQRGVRCILTPCTVLMDASKNRTR
jgi:hypothetical protein